MTWEEYCKKKKIDANLFQSSEPERWKEWKALFEQIHPNSFTEQKKFLINDIRRKYHLKEEEIKESKSPIKESDSPATTTKDAPSTGTPAPVKKPGGIKIPPRKPSTNE